MTERLAQSVKARLVRHAHSLGVDPNLVLARFAAERLLYRLSRSAYAERFVLKGALMLVVWLGETIRPTRDADLLGFGAMDARSLGEIFTEICTLPVEPDGLLFDGASIRVAPIRFEDAYGGQRIELVAHLGSARLRVQVDIGIGDAVVPEPRWIDYPSLLDLPRPWLRGYRPETAIAEKLHAMVELGSKNSRMRDFFDVSALALHERFDGAELARAIAATFERRRTGVPSELPLALTRDFAAVEGKASQWKAFVRRLPTVTVPTDLVTVLQVIARFAGPVLIAVGRKEPFEQVWPAGGPWT
ncbi:MAG: nucleotidyl transferase AbiEii/AbiGii toxin family protein [Thermoanaerobaculia bacterium]|nr:nucleotidyl transferase AbiEii/AbiGii toxin family protein [Thermoanaerobaculia bacterium]